MNHTPFIRWVYLVDRIDLSTHSVQTVEEIFYDWSQAHAVAKVHDGCVRTAALYVPTVNWDIRQDLH